MSAANIAANRLWTRLPAGVSELREAAERIREEDWAGSKACRGEIEEIGC